MKVKHLSVFLFSVTAVIACSQNLPTAETKTQNHNVILDPRVVYGQDDRRDLYQVTDPGLLELADSTVALVKEDQFLSTGNGNLKVKGDNFGSSYNLCSSEPFRDQETAAFCSGFLVGKDLMVTAGHCISDQGDCDTTKFVFGYAVKKAGVLPYQVPEGEVYGCRQILHTQQISAGADFAVVRLDRPVVGHLPLALRTTGQIPVGDGVFVVGHPVGLPTKIASGANVRSVRTGFFVANLDTYGGNSGSAVFNSKSGEVEGILVRGERDFVQQGNCTVSNKCSDSGCRGEDVTQIADVLPYLSGQ